MSTRRVPAIHRTTHLLFRPDPRSAVCVLCGVGDPDFGCERCGAPFHGDCHLERAASAPERAIFRAAVAEREAAGAPQLDAPMLHNLTRLAAALPGRAGRRADDVPMLRVPVVSVRALARPGPLFLAPRDRTLAEYAPVFLKWLGFVRQRRENTVVGYGEDLKTFLGFCEGAGLAKPEDVNFRHLEFYLGWLQSERGVKATTANRHLHALRTFWRWMVREEITAKNPAADVFILPTHKKLPGYLHIPEQEQLLAALVEDRSLLGIRDCALVATPLFTGLRCAELSHLQLGHLDLNAGVLRVVEGKGLKDRELPVIPRLEAILRGYLEVVRPQLVRGPNVYVFVRAASRRGWATRYGTEPVGPKTIFYTIRRLCEAVLHRKVHPHMLRHSFASRLRENGADLQDIQEALGHAVITTTTMYAHLTTRRQREKLAEYLK
jgi:site-specific recombinase XerD